MTFVLPPTDRGIARAAALLDGGEVVGVPTETVYGLAGLLDRPTALGRIFHAKERPRFDPLIVHVRSDPDDPLGALVASGVVDASVTGPAARTALVLLQRCWPGPLSVVLPRGPAVPDIVTAGLETVAVRAPRHPVARRLLDALAGRSFAAPSANRFGRISPTRAEDVVAELGGRIPAVLDGGACEGGLESTVLRIEADGAPTLLRPGGVSAEEIEALLARPVQGPGSEGPARRDDAPRASPGTLASHYAPEVPAVVVDRAGDGGGDEARLSRLLAAAHGAPTGQPLAFLLTAPLPPDALARLAAGHSDAVTVDVLPGDPGAAARALFASLRRLDDASPRPGRLVAERPGPGARGLLHAIRDRLGRAAGRTEPPGGA